MASSEPGANVFRSKLEDLMPAVELVFPPTPAFGDYRPYLEHAVEHPAKANVFLLEFLILKYTEEGDTILDPLSGSGSTGVVAALHGRNAILVEIEPKFYEFIVMAKEKVERAETLTKKGWIVPILGDARKLSGLLTDAVDVCVTSPPYAETELSGGDPERRAERLVRAGYDPRDFLGGRARNAVLKHYDEPPGEGHATVKSGENIGALPLGPVDAVSLERGDGFDVLYRRLMTKNGKPTYLSEMLLVYREMRKVLRKEGRAIVIVKPFAKNRKIIDLPYLTYLLMSKVGFALEALYKLRLEVQSFWRVLYYRKNPDVPRIMHEYVIVAR
jgi:predicted RNA methylase